MLVTLFEYKNKLAPFLTRILNTEVHSTVGPRGELWTDGSYLLNMPITTPTIYIYPAATFQLSPFSSRDTELKACITYLSHDHPTPPPYLCPGGGTGKWSGGHPLSWQLHCLQGPLCLLQDFWRLLPADHRASSHPQADQQQRQGLRGGPVPPH